MMKSAIKGRMWHNITAQSVGKLFSNESSLKSTLKPTRFLNIFLQFFNFNSCSPPEDMEGDHLTDIDGHDSPGAPNLKRVSSRKFRRNRSKLIHCTYCNIYISAQNMQRHMKTKHYTGEEQRYSAICCDRDR